MKHKVKVVMLPTKDASVICGVTELEYRGVEPQIDSLQNQHLYITVSQDVEAIKEGDWFFANQLPHQCLEVIKDSNYPYRCVNSISGIEECHSKHWEKIIATTDPKLLKEHDDSVPIPRMRDTGIAQLQQSFIREFVVNPDGEWEVEYVYGVDILDEYNKEVDYTGSSCIDLQDGLELKLNKDSTVNITSVKEKMYSKEEMYLSAANVVNEIAANRGNSNWNMKVTPKMIVDDWIKETL